MPTNSPASRYFVGQPEIEEHRQTAFIPPSLRGARRRPSAEQGKSLEILGHAIEYLIDSDLKSGDTVPTRHVTEATRILMARSREIFAECPVAVTAGGRVRACLTNMFGRPVLLPPEKSWPPV